MFSTFIQFDWDLSPPTDPQSDYHPGQRHAMIAAPPANDLGSPPDPKLAYLDSFEISNLTIDSNLKNAPFGPRLDSPTTESANITASVSGATVTASAAFFLPTMLGAKITFSNGISALITGFTCATVVTISSSQSFSGVTFKVRVAATASGASVTASSAVFDSGMVGATLVFENGASARIMDVGTSTQATLSSSLNITSGQTFQVFGVRFSITALSIVGDNVRIRRVRCINFGTRTPLNFDGLGTYPGPNRTYEGFPIRIEGRTYDVTSGGTAADKPAFNSWMEDCIIEQPYPSPAREVTYVVGGGWGPVNPPNKLHLEPFGCGIRNCYMNFEFINPRPGNPVKILSSAYSSVTNDVTVTTEFPANLENGDYVEIYGANTALNG